MRNILVISSVAGSLALATMVWPSVSAQQEMLPRPGAGSGVSRVEGNVAVTGTVSVDQMPDVNAKQRGPWRVGITEMPEVHIAGLSFLRAGGRYEVTWPAGDKETLAVTAVASNGWVKVDQRSRWVNLALARSVEAVN